MLDIKLVACTAFLWKWNTVTVEWRMEIEYRMKFTLQFKELFHIKTLITVCALYTTDYIQYFNLKIYMYIDSLLFSKCRYSSVSYFVIVFSLAFSTFTMLFILDDITFLTSSILHPNLFEPYSISILRMQRN
jgi:hypothetical protein